MGAALPLALTRHEARAKLVYAIVTDLSGAIDAKSVLEQGSTFAIYLPLVEAV